MRRLPNQKSSVLPLHGGIPGARGPEIIRYIDVMRQLGLRDRNHLVGPASQQLACPPVARQVRELRKPGAR